MAALDSADLEARIRDAFQGVRLGSGTTLFLAAVADCSDEILDERFSDPPSDIDIFNDWAAISVETMESYPHLYQLDAEGFRYYIPAFMVGVLRDFAPDSERCKSLFDCLVPNKEVENGLYSKNKLYSLLTERQLSVIALFLEYSQDNVSLDGYERKISGRALKNFWSRYL